MVRAQAPTPQEIVPIHSSMLPSQSSSIPLQISAAPVWIEPIWSLQSGVAPGTRVTISPAQVVAVVSAVGHMGKPSPSQSRAAPPTGKPSSINPSPSSSRPLQVSLSTAQVTLTCDQVPVPLRRVGSGVTVAICSTDEVMSVKGGKETPSNRENSIRRRGSKSPSFSSVISVDPEMGLRMVETTQGKGSSAGVDS